MRAWTIFAAGLLLAGLAGCVSPDHQDEALGRDCTDTGTTTADGGPGGLGEDDATRAGDDPPTGETDPATTGCPENATGTTGAGRGPGQVADGGG